MPPWNLIMGFEKTGMISAILIEKAARSSFACREEKEGSFRLVR
jgi:hypothetical protein